MNTKLRKIIQGNKDSYLKWQNLLNDSDAEIQLLHPIAPLINFTYLEVEKITNRLPIVRNLISENFIKNTILWFFKQEIGIIIFRTLISELHNAKTNGALKRNTSKDRFKEFIEIISNVKSIEIIFSKYSALQNLILVNVEQFLNSLGLFFSRLNNDFHDIEAKLNLENLSSYHLENIEFSGDKHQHGQRVIIATFINQKHKKLLVYKPRSLSLVRGLENFLSWINSSTNFNFRLPTTLLKNNYGWQIFLYNESCHHKEDAEFFFHHLGGLLCIFHLLNSQDIHSENIIANGKYPILIDCECLLTPVILQNKKLKSRERNLVCSSLVLPTRNMSNHKYSGFDNSVIGNSYEQILPFSTLSWNKEGTDEMTLKRISGKLLPHKSRPHLNSEPFNPDEFEDEFLTGFNQIYNFLLINKSKLLYSKNSPLNYFNDCTSRVIIRPTNQYAKLSIESYHPLLLHNLERRAEHFLFLENSIRLTPEYKHFINSELESLNENNIPIFYSNTSKKYVYDCDHNKINIRSLISPTEHVKQNMIKFWGKSDLDIQNTIIKNSFATLRYPNYQDKLIAQQKKIEISNKHLSASVIKKNILNICKLLYNKMIKDGGYISWPCIIPAGSKITQSITDNSLYNGTLGIIYTLGICGYKYNISAYKDLISDYVEFLIREAKNNPHLFNSIGLYDGIGGVVYFLHYFSEIIPLINSDLINRFLFCFDLLIFEEQKLDIMSGHAGFLLSLLRAKNNINHDIFTKYITYSKNKLLKAIDTPIHELFIPSYAHGITGIYYTLCKLYDFEKDKSLIRYIDRCLITEEKYYNENYNSWIGSSETDKTSTAWCHGAIGIGLARLTIRSKIDFLGSTNDHFISAAIDSTLNKGFQTDPCLCHGHAGSLDFLLEANMNNFNLSETENAIYSSYLNAFLKNVDENEFTFYKTKGAFVPGLFDGLSGIVYVLLRLTFPREISSILMI